MTEPRRRGFYYTPGALDRLRQEEANHRAHQREAAQKDARFAPWSGVFRPYRGTDHIGRPYDDLAKTGAWRDRPELRGGRRA